VLAFLSGVPANASAPVFQKNLQLGMEMNEINSGKILLTKEGR
jgi:hypothetical protein